MQALNFFNGFSYALEQGAEALESFHEPLDKISWALGRNVRRPLAMTCWRLGQNVRTLSRLLTIC